MWSHHKVIRNNKPNPQQILIQPQHYHPGKGLVQYVALIKNIYSCNASFHMCFQYVKPEPLTYNYIVVLCLEQ